SRQVGSVYSMLTSDGGALSVSSLADSPAIAASYNSRNPEIAGRSIPPDARPSSTILGRRAGMSPLPTNIVSPIISVGTYPQRSPGEENASHAALNSALPPDCETSMYRI